jgi:hypothetical protein
VVLLADVDSSAQATRVVRRLLDSLELPVVVEGRSWNIGASVGVVTNDHNSSAEHLVAVADTVMLRAKSRGKGRWALAPVGMAASETGRAQTDGARHGVHLSASADEVIGSLVRYVREGLSRGEGVLVVATPEHRTSLEARLRGCGVDVAAVTASGQLVSLDAAATLEQLLVDGAPCAAQFQSVVGTLVQDLVLRWSRLRVYGEMVSLLWGEADVVGALRLEDQWNQLRAQLPFSLLCGYLLSEEAGIAAATNVAAVHARHTHRVG